MSLLLALGTEQIVLFVVLLAILILYPVFMVIRNKKATNQQQQVYDSLTKGDKVLMSCGIIGKVVKIETKNDIKSIIIETGDDSKKSTLTFDINAVYMNLSSQEAIKVEQTPVQEDSKDTQQVKEESVDVNTEEVVSEKTETKVKTKKNSKKSK